MPAINYRNQARAFLKQAQAELATGEDHRLRYAALELRFAMEALTYDRAWSYREELPPSEYDTWQPRKLLQVLLEIDPTADKDNSISIGIEEEYGVEAPKMIFLGQETVLNLSVLKKNYDALGNILHVPELRHADKPPSFTKLRARCEGIADYVGKVLASPVWNGTLGNFAEITCHCGDKIRKRLPHGKDEITAECFNSNCKASYTVTENGDGSIGAKPELTNVPCSKEGCTQVMQLFRREIQPNLTWSCAECGEKNVLLLTVSLIPKANDETPAAAKGT